MNKQIGIESTAQSSVDFGRRDLLKLTGAGVAALGAASLFSIPFAKAQDMSNGANNFYTSDRVGRSKRLPSRAKTR